MTTQHAGETATEHNISFNLNRLLEVARMQHSKKDLTDPIDVHFRHPHVVGLIDCIDLVSAAAAEIDGALPGLDLLIEHILDKHPKNDAAMQIRGCLMPLRQLLISVNEDLKATVC